MKYKIQLIIPFLLALLLVSCESNSPNTNKQGKDELKSLEVEHAIDEKQMKYHDLIYIPIYSDIYINAQNPNSLLAATLSIRNTSRKDPLFVSKIDYYNTEGRLVRKYLEKTISLPPMATINYVIEKEDETGGPGANFLVELEAKNANIKPLIQAVMIGEHSNKSYAFSTDGYSIK